MIELWKYRELIWNLTVADLKNRYQNTALGFIWSVLNPLLMATVLYFVFRFLYSQTSDFFPYLLVGLMAWRFFANGTGSSLGAVIGRSSLVTRVYIPRQILVMSNAMANLIGSLLEFVFTIPIVFIFTWSFPATIFVFPLIHVIYFVFVYGIGLFLAAAYIYFRDLNQIWEVIVSALFFLSPILYPLSIIKESMPIYLLNPITEFVIIYRDLILFGKLPTLYSMAIVSAAAIAAYFAGSIIFNKLQKGFAEEL